MSPEVLRFVVPGEPVGKMRARTFVRMRRDGKPFATTTTPEKTRSYEAKVRTLCAIAVNQARWLTSKSDRFAIRLRVFRTHEGAGADLDNVIKSVADAIQGPGLAMPDDRYVRRISAALLKDASNPRVEVEILRARLGENAA
jgi:Holliday junction resolvase RusA-like endonuclease